MDHPGLIGVMGGEPTLHPRFADMCQYLYEKLPKEKLTPPDAFTLPTDSFIEVRRRQELDAYVIYPYENGLRPVVMGAGLWTTITPNYMKNFEIIQDVFRFQNLNDHTNASYHQPILISRKDMGIGDKEWLKLREKCWVNQLWSSSITPKGCFFCEVAGALDMLYDGPGGLPIEPGWWKRDIEDFKEQFRWCELCGIPLKTFGRDAREGIVDVSEENLALLKDKQTARYVPERLNVVKIDNGIISEESKKAASAYHGVTYIEDAQERISKATPIYADSFTGVMLCDTAEEFEKNRAAAEKNLAYLSALYIVVDGKTHSCLRGQEEQKLTAAEKCSLTDFLKEQTPGTYFLFMTPGVELGAGFEKLKKCVVNPGTLHLVDFENQESRKPNPYIANAEKLTSGICALLNNNALFLKTAEQEIELSPSGLRRLWKIWRPEKRVELSDRMDKLMLGVGDPERQRETKKRRRQDGVYILKKWIHRYGALKTGYYGASIVKHYGLKWTINKIKARIF